MVAQGDYLSRLLHQGQVGWSVMLLGMLAAFAFGAVHALSPGHGKTLVAAYLVGSRGTPRHAVFLGLMVTFTHTISVFALGLVTLYLSRFVLPETITPILGVISGLTIVWVGAMLLYRRTLGRRAAPVHTGLAHDHGDGTGGSRTDPAAGLQCRTRGHPLRRRPRRPVCQTLAAGQRDIGAAQGDALPSGGQRGLHRLCRDRDDFGFTAAGALTRGASCAIFQSSPIAASASSTEVASLPPK